MSASPSAPCRIPSLTPEAAARQGAIRKCYLTTDNRLIPARARCRRTPSPGIARRPAGRSRSWSPAPRRWKATSRSAPEVLELLSEMKGAKEHHERLRIADTLDKFVKARLDLKVQRRRHADRLPS